MNKRFWAALLALILCLGCLAPTALAQPKTFENTYHGSGIGAIGQTKETDTQPDTARGIVNPRPDVPYSPQFYFQQLDSISKAIYTAMLESDLYRGPSKQRVEVDLSSIPLAERKMVATLVQTKTGPTTGYWRFSENLDPLSCAFMALTYDHPELSWLDQTAFQANIHSDFDGVTPFFSSMQVGESRQFQQPLTLFRVEYQLTDEGYAQATTDCDALTGKNRFHYADTKDRPVIEAALAKATSQIGDIASKPEHVQLRLIHDWVCENMAYADTRDPKYVNDWRGYQTVYSALIDGVTVCAGYAKSFKLLCDAYGIPCVLVRGVAGGQMHLWNYVQLEDAWYAVDCTWDDEKGNGDNYAFFLKGKDGFPDHQEGPLWDNGAVFAYPALSGPDYSSTATRETDHFVFLGTDVHKESLEALEQLFEDCCARLIDHFGKAPSPKTEVHLYPDQAALDGALDTLFGSQPVPSGNPAVALAPNQLFMVEPADPGSSDDEIVSEALHEFIYLAMEQFGTNTPAHPYLSVGIAHYEDGNPIDPARIKQDMEKGALPTIPALDSSSLKAVQPIYAEAFVEFIVRTYGWEEMTALLRGQSRQSVLKVTDDELERHWTDFLQREYCGVGATKPQLTAESTLVLADTPFGMALTGLDASTSVQSTTVSSLASHLVVGPGETLVIKDSSGDSRALDDVVATGDTAQLHDRFGNSLWTVTLVVRGDVTGSGKLNIAQLVALSQAFLGNRDLSGPFLQAGNLSGSGTISIVDLVLEANLLSGKAA